MKILASRHTVFRRVAALGCALLVLSGPVDSQDYGNVTSLISAMLSGYTPYMRPVQNQSSTVVVNVSLILFNLLEVDTVKGVLTLVAKIPCTWTDERISWTPADYDRATSIRIEQQYVWTPPLSTAQPVKFESLGQKWMTVTYQSDGSAKWSPAGIYEITCPMNMKYWPYDEQKCVLSYFVYDQTDTEAFVQPGTFSTRALVENFEWSIHDTGVSTRNIYGQTEVVFSMTIRRKFDFFTATLIVPLITLSMLSSFVFILPSESGERVSFCITILLSFTVFLDVISDDIPKLSPPLPIICQYLVIGLMMSGITTIVVIFNLYLHQRGDQSPVPSAWKFFVRIVHFRSKRIGTETKTFDTNQQDEVTVMDMTDTSVKVRPLSARPTAEVKGQREETEVTWIHVSNAVDRVCFVLLFTFSTIYTFANLLILRFNL